MSLEHGNHQFGIFSDLNFDDDDAPQNIACWWQGCGNIQPNLGSSGKHFTGEFAGEQKERNSYNVYIPNNWFTRNLLKQTGIYIVSLEPNQLYYSDIFKCQMEAIQATPDNCWLKFPCHRKVCTGGCKEKDMWCGAATSCPNGVVAEYDPIECPDFCEWLNCQTPGTTVCLPSGEYEACEVTVPYLCIQAIDDDALIVISGDWVLAEGVKVLLP